MIIGITGSIGSGKSEVSKILKSFGFFIIDADKISHQITKKGGSSLEEIAYFFGKSVLNKNGSLNRKKLASIVFSVSPSGKSGAAAKKKLEKILHPKIISKIKELTRKHFKKNIVLDAPLLFETGLDKICDKTLAIVIEPSLQFKRLQKSRKLNKEQIEGRIKSQMSQEQKASLADFVIDNNCKKKELKKKVALIIGCIFSSDSE